MSYVDGKVALITGGSGAIGNCLVVALLKSGAKGIGIADLSEDVFKNSFSKLDESLRNRIVFIKTDITNHEEFENAFQKTIEKFGNLDIVINNAGNTDESQWEMIVAVNLNGTFRGTKLAYEKYLPKYKSSDSAVIVNISSVVGIEAIAGLPTYGPTKTAIIGLGRVMDLDYYFKKSNIRVLTICPGAIDTPFFEQSLTHAVEKPGPELMKKISKPSYIGDNIVNLINANKRGIWVLEDEEPPYKVKYPSRKEMRIDE